MLKSAIPAPVIIGPGTPISEQAWDSSLHPTSGFSVRTAGGPTNINLFWDSLLEAAERVEAAAAVFTEIRQDLVTVAGELGSTPGHLHWRSLGFQTQFGTMLTRTAGTEVLLDQASTGAEAAHQAYRDVETTVQSWFTLLLRVSDYGLVVEHLLTPDGDKSLVYDWLVTTGVVTGGLALDTPAASALVSALTAAEEHADLSAELLEGHEQVLDPIPANEFFHVGDGTLGNHLQNMAEVSDHGDIAVSSIEKQSGETSYVLYLPGVDIDGLNTDHGRSPMSLADAFGNDSQHMSAAVEDALQTAGVPEGATVLPIGHSMGGGHVLNLVNNTSWTEKYTVPAAATIGSPGQNKRVETDVKLTHFEDERDPIPHALGQRHQESADRLSVIYDHQNPQSEVGSVAGSAHSLQHNTDAISTLEDHASDALSAEETAHLDVLRGHLAGNVRTMMFTTRWQSRDGAVGKSSGNAANPADRAAGSRDLPSQRTGGRRRGSPSAPAD
ncbi:hypothetical protein [Garicola koreensis]|uniref:Alpha/beta hydrolase n=1 Tax=Garicola koreensis TaxID=1262554 RepID=A0A7W5TSU9_9MICC|nr:hypothetical protein [Garicola koreensis]MBB3668022.1 hypothetical protein [Garicola koreensis]